MFMWLICIVWILAKLDAPFLLVILALLGYFGYLFSKN